MDCHIPMLIAAPWIKTASSGLHTSALAEAVDIMPTLIDLAGLPPCADPCTDGVGPAPGTPSGLQGQSLMPALLAPPTNGTGDPKQGFKQYAFSQFPRCNCTYAIDRYIPGDLNGTCQGAYVNAFTQEQGATGAANHHVCLFTPSAAFDWMGYGTFRADFHHFDHIELDLHGYTHVWGASFSCLRLKLADIVLI